MGLQLFGAGTQHPQLFAQSRVGRGSRNRTAFECHRTGWRERLVQRKDWRETGDREYHSRETYAADFCMSRKTVEFP